MLKGIKGRSGVYKHQPHSEKTKEKIREAIKRYMQLHPESGFQKGNKPTHGFQKGHKINNGRSPWHKGKKTGIIPKSAFKKGCMPWNWKGDKVKQAKGYILIYQPNHPFHSKQNYVFEHRLVMEKHLGRYLKPKERVHHINNIVGDNRIENLMLFKNKVYHRWFHKKGFCNPKGIIFDGRNKKRKEMIGNEI